MTERSNASARESATDDIAEWRPYRVWESQVRSGSGRGKPLVTVQSSRESWDPFAVWKRHIRR